MSETRIWVLLARKAQNAVVLRRGPAKQVLLLRWDMTRGTFEEGQWLKGRIFERRCDLSPSGERLVYFAAKHKGTHGFGTWGGGGLFANEERLELNARAIGKPNEGGLPPRLRVEPMGDHPGLGEDDPISHLRLLRDRWTLAQPGTMHRKDRLDPFEAEIAGKVTKLSWHYDPPRVYRRIQATKPGAILEMRVHGMHEVNGPWYAVEHAILDSRERERASLGRSDWADWDALGHLLFARAGRIYRVAREHVFDVETHARELVDLRPLTFTRRVAPDWARQWLTRRPSTSERA